jgi:hypothetical protein
MIFLTERLNADIGEEREVELIRELYDYMCFGTDFATINRYIKCGYLTCNTGSDGNDYFWHLDNESGAAIDMEGNIIEGEKELNKLFNIS